MAKAANLGFPRIGARRELKRALDAHWAGRLSAAELAAEAAGLRARHWQAQKAAGIDVIPSNDFSLYDHVLDTTAMLGAVPARFGAAGERVSPETCFAMARGTAEAPAMEMTKWFDTNYHYIVPEIAHGQQFQLASPKPVEEFLEAQALGVHTRPVLLGPVTWAALGKARETGVDPLAAVPAILPIYEQVLLRLAAAGADWVQIDEPILVTDLSDDQRRALASAYGRLGRAGPKVMLATYFGGLGDNLALALGLPVAGLHLDLVRDPAQLGRVLAAGTDKVLSLGLIDGRNVWRADLSAAHAMAEAAARLHGGDRIEIAPSCSLLHVPVDLDAEETLEADLREWLAFAHQKLAEVATLARAIRGEDAADAFRASDSAKAARAASRRIHDPAVAARAAGVTAADLCRASVFCDRQHAQAESLPLPLFPTTTIGSFPQTAEVRHARAEHRRGTLDDAGYEAFLKAETAACIRRQEALGLDMLVHGEFERNDMVEYFGERLAGFAFTRMGWVQSYGSRCVKPPLIFGDVSRPEPMTVDWARFAQSLTERPVKGMLTGPVTILQWSFVRDDQPRSETCRQIALAIRDEVADLEGAGVRAIQIDEPALREGLPLRRAEREAYLSWAVDSFRLAASPVRDETQIHTHMCYSEFNDIMPAIAALDADVISIEASRSDMELLRVFGEVGYPNAIGPGIWDIHSPRVPPLAEMTALLARAAEVIPAERLWVNPDCGLKTRGWPEVEASLKTLVAAAQGLRQQALAAE